MQQAYILNRMKLQKLLEKLGYTKEDVKNQIAARRAERKGESYQKCDRHQDKTDIKTLNNHSDGNTGIKPNGFKDWQCHG